MATVTANSITSTSNLEKIRIELNNLISDVTNVDSSINANSVLSTDSLEDLIIQFNTLVKDVDSI